MSKSRLVGDVVKLDAMLIQGPWNKLGRLQLGSGRGGGGGGCHQTGTKIVTVQ